MGHNLTIALLVAGMLITGCLNTLLLKYQDQTCSGSECNENSFPVWQSWTMFFGESLCFLIVGLLKVYASYSSRSRISQYSAVSTRSESELVLDEEDALLGTVTKTHDHPELKGAAICFLAIPSLFDVCGTTIMSIGLLYVPASIYQMCRGVLVLFVGLLSVLLLGRRLVLSQWTCLFLVTLGVFIVGFSSVVSAEEKPRTMSEDRAKSTLMGVLLITGAQIFTAGQFVVEEFILGKYSIEPLKVAGWEGVWGISVTSIAMAIAYNVYGRSHEGGIFDIARGFQEITQNASIWPAFVVFAVSIASFNYFGLSVTRSVSATSRSTIDTCRTLFIWLISLALGWEHFKILQLTGFTILVYATLVFNGAIPPFPSFLRSRSRREIDASAPHTLE